MMKNEKLYNASNHIQTSLWVLGIILVIIGRSVITFALTLAAIVFILLSVFMIVSHIYFKRAPVFWVKSGTGILAILSTALESILSLAIGLAIIFLLL